MLKVNGKRMNLEKIPLKTVRQFLIQDVVLADFEDQFTPDTPQVVKKVESLCHAKVQLLEQPPFTHFEKGKKEIPVAFSPSPAAVGHRDAGGG